MGFRKVDHPDAALFLAWERRKGQDTFLNLKWRTASKLACCEITLEIGSQSLRLVFETLEMIRTVAKVVRLMPPQLEIRLPCHMTTWLRLDDAISYF